MAFSLAPDSPVEFIHPRDAATALVNVLARPEAHGRIHLIGGGKLCQVTTLRMVQTMMGALGIAISADDELGPEVDVRVVEGRPPVRRHRRGRTSNRDVRCRGDTAA